MRLIKKAGDAPKRSLWQRIKDVAVMDVRVLSKGGVAPGSLEQLEQLLLEADFGVPVTLRLVEEVERRAASSARNSNFTTRSPRASSARCGPATAGRRCAPFPPARRSSSSSASTVPERPPSSGS